MTNQNTIDKLIEMRLTTMADAFRNQLDDPKLKEVPFKGKIKSITTDNGMEFAAHEIISKSLGYLYGIEIAVIALIAFK